MNGHNFQRMEAEFICVRVRAAVYRVRCKNIRVLLCDGISFFIALAAKTEFIIPSHFFFGYYFPFLLIIFSYKTILLQWWL